MLEELERQAVLVYTPSRKVNGKRVVCYDDRYIVKVAYEQDGIIVSNDNYRDLQSENPEWKWFIEQRLLMFSFVNDRYVVAEGGPARSVGGQAESHLTSLGHEC